MHNGHVSRYSALNTNFGKITQAAIDRIKERGFSSSPRTAVLCKQISDNDEFILHFDKKMQQFELFSSSYYAYVYIRDAMKKEKIDTILSEFKNSVPKAPSKTPNTVFSSVFLGL